MSLSLKQLEAFIWVSDLGSFRRAAERLNTTQPNISSRTSSLESVLKVILMERDAGSVRLTTKGRDLLVHARKVLRSVETLVEASDDTLLLDGVLNLGVTEMIAHTWLRDFLKALKERFPNIAVELTVDLSVNLERGLLERSIDLALQSEPFRHQTTGSKDLGTYPFIWVASPALGLYGKGPADIEELAAHTILPGRPAEFHRQPPTDPDLTLSCHPARAIARRLPPSAEQSGSSQHCRLAHAQQR